MKNTSTHYGWLSIFFHWAAALTIIGLFALGFYMVELGYYDSGYKTLPALHKSIGITLLGLMLLRLLWRLTQLQPAHLTTHKPIERKAGKLIHNTLYLLIFIIMLSGYLISTADGRGIEVFGLFELPGFGSLFNNQEDLAGVIHEWFAYLMISLTAMHALAALKHHFIDKDDTLKRMLGKRQENKTHKH
jgi:cytochrome b561